MAVGVIYLDMDGVVVNHYKSFFRLFGRELDEAKWPKGIADSKTALGIGGREFDKRIIAAGAQFWADMEEYPWYMDFWRQLNAVAPVYYLSSPEFGPGCLAGKLQWLETRHAEGFGKFIFTQHKMLLAKPDAVLIDDCPGNLEKFTALGGQGVLFERPWNSPAASKDPAAKALETVKGLAGKP